MSPGLEDKKGLYGTCNSLVTNTRVIEMSGNRRVRDGPLWKSKRLQ